MSRGWRLAVLSLFGEAWFLAGSCLVHGCFVRVCCFVLDSRMVAWQDYVRLRGKSMPRSGSLSNYTRCPRVHRVRRLGFVCTCAPLLGTQAAHRSRGLTCTGKHGMFRVPGGHPWTSCLTRSWRRLLHILHHTAKLSHRPERRRSPNTVGRKSKRRASWTVVHGPFERF